MLGVHAQRFWFDWLGFGGELKNKEPRLRTASEVKYRSNITLKELVNQFRGSQVKCYHLWKGKILKQVCKYCFNHLNNCKYSSQSLNYYMIALKQWIKCKKIMFFSSWQYSEFYSPYL